ncbi:MAG: YceI family protein [Verrucomicrobiota bacterium]
MNTIALDQVREALSAQPKPHLLDVRLADDFAVSHIQGAESAPVFPVTFLQDVAALVDRKDTPLLVYGADAESRESQLAAEKLENAGYTAVRDFMGGLAAWEQAGGPVERGATPPPPPAAPEGELAVDLAASRLEWTGRNLLNKHWGTLPLKTGALGFEGGKLVSGSFVLDLTGMECTDLAGQELHQVLIDHLQSDDFFHTAQYPEAQFVISGSRVLEPTSLGAPNLALEGHLTLKGQTLPLQIQAVTGLTPDGKAAAQATLSIDRTLWQIIYGSGKLFRNPGMHLVNDLIDIELKIVTL